MALARVVPVFDQQPARHRTTIVGDGSSASILPGAPASVSQNRQ